MSLEIMALRRIAKGQTPNQCSDYCDRDFAAGFLREHANGYGRAFLEASFDAFLDDAFESRYPTITKDDPSYEIVKSAFKEAYVMAENANLI